MDDPVGVGVLERLADAVRDLERRRDVDPPLRRLLEQAFERPARHVLADDERLTALLADVVDRDDVRVVAQPRHRLGFPSDPEPPALVEAPRLDQGDRHVAVEHGVVREVDPLAPSFAEVALDEVAAAGDPHGRGIAVLVAVLLGLRRRGAAACEPEAA